ncbi:MAG: tetratricopeptide repeat protein [Anaerolineales bacterium]|nr:tetratricopeptide repeat protein [Anaerolineales bacterium]
MALQAAWLEMRSLGKIPRLEATDGYAEIAKVAYDLGLEEVANEAAKEIEKSLADLPLSAEAARWLLVPTMVTGLLDGFAAGLDKVELLPKPDESEPSYLTPYWATMGSLLIQAGRLKEAEELFARSLGLVERYALFDEYYPVNNNLGVCLMEQGRLEEARRHFDAAIEYAKAETSPSHHATGRDNLTILAYEAGEYEEATQLGSRLLVADGPTSGVRMVMSLHAIVGLSCLELGRLRQCREAERELQILLDRHGPLSNDLSYVHTFLARMRSLRGEEDEAVAALGRAAAFYEGRNVLAKLRIELERFRILTRIGVDCRDGLRTLLQTAMPTGARPLVVRIQAQLERGQRAPG